MSCTTSDDYFHCYARLRATESEKKGADYFYQNCITQHGAPFFDLAEQNRGCIHLLMIPSRDMVTFLFRIVSVIVTMFTGYVHGTQMETARETQNANDRNAEYVKALNLRDTFKRHYAECERGSRYRCV